MTILGKYELHEELGKGGFGAVYRAVDTSLGREVAIKILHPQLTVDQNFIARFRREARILASLDNRHIVTIYELDEVDGRIFISMRNLSGGSLKAVIQQKGALPNQQADAILRQVINGLKDAHTKGLIHRDLKPENILFDAHGEAAITDFGLVRDSRDSSFSIGPSGGILGTPSYIAPEIWKGAPASAVSDIYALGCIFYEMLSGRVLFEGTTPWDIMQKHSEEVVLPGVWPEGTPPGTANFLRKALEKDPSHRFQSVLEMEAALSLLTSPERLFDGPRAPTFNERMLGYIRALAGRLADRKEKAGAGTRKRMQSWKVWAPILAVVVIAAAAVYLYPVNAYRGFFFSANTEGQKDIYFINSEHAIQRITKSEPGQAAWDPQPATDGTLFFTCDRFKYQSEICALDPDGGEVYRQTHTPGLFESWDPAPASGRNLYFTSNRNGVVEILLLNNKAEIQKVIHSANGSDSWDAAPAKDGKLYFTSNSDGGEAEIFVLEKGWVRQVTYTGTGYESWDPTPDSNGRLFFTSNRDKGQADIYVIERDGEVRRVTNSPENTSSWNPVPGKDGGLYFTSNRFGRTELVYMNAAGKLQVVTSVPGSTEDIEPDPENGRVEN